MTMTFRSLTPEVFVAGQIDVADLTVARALGITQIINNRPDDEEPGQPASLLLETAALAAGMAYVHIPVRGMPGDHAVSDMADALATGQPSLMFCKSGMRSAVAWALASARVGDLSREQILAAVSNAGFDLSGLPLD